MRAPDLSKYTLLTDWANQFRTRPMSCKVASRLCRNARIPGAIQYPDWGPRLLRRWWVPKGSKDPRKAHGRPTCHN